MKDTKLFQCIWYVCPNCSTENTVRLSDPLFNKGFRCVSCKAIWTCDGLFTLCYNGTPIPPKDKLAPAGEWQCECGRRNIILPRTERMVESIMENGDKCCTEYVEIPKYGLCEDCFAEYNLIVKE